MAVLFYAMLIPLSGGISHPWIYSNSLEITVCHFRILRVNVRPKTSTNCFRAFFCPKGKHKPGAEERSPYRFHQYTSVSFRPAAGGGPRTPAVSSAPHPRTRGRCGSPAGLHPLIPVTSMRLPLPVLTVMAVSRGNLPETVGPRRWVHCVLF